MRHRSDVVEPGDPLYTEVAAAASGAPIGAGPGHVAYPLYGLGQDAPVPAASFVQRLKWPVVGFVAGAATMGAVWFYFGHWLPLKKRAEGRKRT
jgi:hypothetical protein